MKKLSYLLLTFILLTSNLFAASLDLDYMEYANDAAAQAAYVTNAVETATLDQSYTKTPNSQSAVKYDNTYYYVSQSFIPSVTATMPQLILKLFRNGTPTGNIWVEIETDSSNKPSNTTVTNGTSANIDVTTISNIDYTEYTFTFATPPSLTASTQYHIVLKGDYSNSTSNFIGWGESNEATLYGYRNYSNSALSWSNFSGYSGYFKTYYNLISLQSYSEATIKTQGSYALKGVATTGALNKTLTKTAALGNLSGVNNLKFDIYSSRTGSNIKLGIVDAGGTTEITPNVITANTWQTVNWDISGVADANKNAITAIVVTVTNADSANTVYLDYAEIAQAIDVFGWVN